MHNPKKFDPSLFKSKEQIEREREEAAARTYVLYERVHYIGGGFGRIIEISDNDMIRVQFENGTKTLINKKSLEKAEQLPPPEKIEINEEKNVGDFVDYLGHQYRVESSIYISASEADDLEDSFDVFDAAGWHTSAVLVH